jgi:hypothetical protein
VITGARVAVLRARPNSTIDRGADAGEHQKVDDERGHADPAAVTEFLVVFSVSRVGTVFHGLFAPQRPALT